jgi:hypothetical protein
MSGKFGKLLTNVRHGRLDLMKNALILRSLGQ